jgi:epoxyqueuosine reductase
MLYMERYFDLRIDPTKLLPGARSVISLAYNYSPATDPNEGNELKLSRYAQGRDYHKVLRQRLKWIVQGLQADIGDFAYRLCVDSAPVLEKAWASRSGVGWQGKHTNLLHKERGSYFFLAEIICDLEMVYDGPMRDYCGTCTRCIDACPTQALFEPYKIDASKCISYLTIERKEAMPEELKLHLEGWVFGCDICQEVCPWNRFSTPHKEPSFLPTEARATLKDADLKELEESAFHLLFEGTAVKRTGFKGLKRNIEAAKRK